MKFPLPFCQFYSKGKILLVWDSCQFNCRCGSKLAEAYFWSAEASPTRPSSSQDSPLAVVDDTLILSFTTVKYLSIIYFVGSSLLVKILLLLFFFVFNFILFLNFT